MTIKTHKFVVFDKITNKNKGNYRDLEDAVYRYNDLKKSYPSNEYGILNKETDKWVI